MSAITIKKFADQIKLEPSKLIQQLSNAGINNKEPTDILDDAEKRQLLDYLRGGNKITAHSTIGEKYTLEVNRKSPKSAKRSGVFVKRDRSLEIKQHRIELKNANKHIERLNAELIEAKKKLHLIQKKEQENEKNLDISLDKKHPIESINPKVFISYSYDSKTHNKWVKSFATKLVENGVETMLDQWILEPGDPITQFMEKGISDSDFVLIVCTEKYKKKSDARAGGLGYEEAIISSDLFESGNHRKYIPILRSNSRRDAIPITLSSKFFLDFSEQADESESLTDLLLTIYGQRPGAPKLGSPPNFQKLKNDR